MRDLSSYMMARAFTGHVIREMQPDAPVAVPAQPRRRRLRNWISSVLHRLADLVAPVAEQREPVRVSSQ